MESNSSTSRQSRLLGKLLGKLRGEHRYSSVDKKISFISTTMSENVGCGTVEDETETVSVHVGSSSTLNDVQFAANIDMRYGGQYLTPEQLPEFCNQLHHLVEVIRNIQSYAKVTGEYPSELERRLEREARSVAALAREVRNAREAASRARLQRRALRAERAHVAVELLHLRETEIRELESSLRTFDRKLYKSWETLRDSKDPAAFDPLLEETRNRQVALECLTRLIENRKLNLLHAPTPRPLPLTIEHEDDVDSECGTSEEFSSMQPRNDAKDLESYRDAPASAADNNSATSGTTQDTIRINGIHKRQDVPNRSSKRKRKNITREPRSMPLSLEPSHHNPQQVTLYIQGSGVSSQPRSLELQTRPSVRNILFFSAD